MQPANNPREHRLRVMHKEGTPWMRTHGILPTFENKKDQFIEKYQVLLQNVDLSQNLANTKLMKQKRKLKKNSKSSFTRSQSEKQLSTSNLTNTVNYDQKLQKYFDRYIEETKTRHKEENFAEEKQILDQFPLLFNH